MEIRPANPRDVPPWLEVRRALWPHIAKEAHEQAIEELLSPASPGCFLVFHEEGQRMGYVEGRIHPGAGGEKASGGIGVIESWYILPNFRWDGIGQQLLRAVEDWFRSQGCIAIQSEGAIGKEAGYKHHVAVPEGSGAPRLRFKKALRGPEG